MSNEKLVYVIIGGASDLATATGKKILEQGGSLVLIHHNQKSLNRVLPTYNVSSVETYIADITDFPFSMMFSSRFSKTTAVLT